ncbi:MULTISPECIES: hypothetical protein [Halomonas]|uniref:Uncharacterized protein n=2 Tax=Halomonadaceae TaxID=28256 RepID=A0ABQ0U6A4_9GAMM|nr:hypothetical protein CVH10_14570 [Halomonas sp. ND22Bw]RAH37477.1 hypothetical protein C9J49_011290 [Halomonas sp. SL1]GEK73915.1 hypothetical protein HHA04nite_24590 [Halomonas halophila]
MLLSDSMSLLWLTYAVLSLVVLGTGYLGLAFLPRLPRLVITWTVAGIMWVPASFQLPLTTGEGVYQGFAPAVVVAGLAFLSHDGGAMLPALMLVAVAAGLGALVGLLLWRRGRRAAARQAPEQESEDKGRQDGGEARREPVIG